MNKSSHNNLSWLRFKKKKFQKLNTIDFLKQKLFCEKLKIFMVFMEYLRPKRPMKPNFLHQN